MKVLLLNINELDAVRGIRIADRHFCNPIFDGDNKLIISEIEIQAIKELKEFDYLKLDEKTKIDYKPKELKEIKK